MDDRPPDRAEDMVFGLVVMAVLVPCLWGVWLACRYW